MQIKLDNSRKRMIMHSPNRVSQNSAQYNKPHHIHPFNKHLQTFRNEIRAKKSLNENFFALIAKVRKPASYLKSSITLFSIRSSGWLFVIFPKF